MYAVLCIVYWVSLPWPVWGRRRGVAGPSLSPSGCQVLCYPSKSVPLPYWTISQPTTHTHTHTHKGDFIQMFKGLFEYFYLVSWNDILGQNNIQWIHMHVIRDQVVVRLLVQGWPQRGHPVTLTESQDRQATTLPHRTLKNMLKSAIVHNPHKYRVDVSLHLP